jgi:hypothetical protein
MALGCDSTNSRAISRQLLHDSRSAAEMMVSTLAGVRTARGRPAFTCAVGVTLPVSNRPNTLASRRLRER